MSRSFAFSSEEYKDIYSKVPKVCVELVLQINDGIVLTLRQHHSWNNQWHLPGGSVNYRESVVTAVKRIGKDELGVLVDVGELLGYIEYWSEEKERGFGYSITLPFMCTTEDTLPEINDQAEEIKVFNKIPENTIKEHRIFLNDKLGLRVVG